MKNSGIEKNLQIIHDVFPYLWDKYNFRLAYINRYYERWNGFLIGYENDTCKLVFRREMESFHYPVVMEIGSQKSDFRKYMSEYYQYWFHLENIIYYISGKKPLKYILSNGEGVPSDKDIDILRSNKKLPDVIHETIFDLNRTSLHIEPHMNEVMDFFRKPDEIKEKLKIYRDAQDSASITIDDIKAERKRLKELGLDYSLKTALENLKNRN